MKKALFLITFLIFVAVPLVAQDQGGSVAIAGSIRPSASDITLVDFTNCVAELKDAGMKPKEAVKACTKVAEINAHTTTRVANEAADATKASRPVVVSGYSGGYYGGGYGYSNYSRPPVRVIRPPIVIPPRPAKKSAPVTTSRPSASRSNAPPARSSSTTSRSGVSKR